MTTTVDVNEAQQQLSRLLELAKAGNEVIIVEGNIPVARLTAITPTSVQHQARIAGLHQGAAWASDNFDQPLPDEFWTGTP